MSTTGHIDALVEMLQDHTWTSTTPAAIEAGSITDNLLYPQVGVLASRGVKVGETIDIAEYLDTVEITIASPQEVDGAKANQAMLLEMKDELIALLHTSPHFADPSAVRSSNVTGWDWQLVVFETDLGDQLAFDYVTVTCEVRYAVALS